MPAKRIVILEFVAPNKYNYVLWADVPAGRQSRYADPNKTSRYKDATTNELTALQSGAVAELAGQIEVPSGSQAAVIEAQLADVWAVYQNNVTNENPWLVYGTIMDNNNVWTIVGTP
jgi:hypothetical protein